MKTKAFYKVTRGFSENEIIVRLGEDVVVVQYSNFDDFKKNNPTYQYEETNTYKDIYPNI